RGGGVAALAAELYERYRDKFQTKEMAAMRLKRGKICDTEQVQKLRCGLPENIQLDFLLKGELSPGEVVSAKEREWDDPDFSAKANTHPESYKADAFFDLCQVAASSYLEKDIFDLCLNPASSVAVGPWYFPELISVLREYQDAHKTGHANSFATDLGKKIHEVLDYAAFSRGLVLMEGEARRGKSFAARQWCEQRPGAARFVEVPPGNDDTGFFRALARALGLGNCLQYKAYEHRERVESVLLAGDLVLVLDEAQRLWPQQNLRYGFPRRVVWVMAMANAGVPIGMISTPQFITTQKAVEKSGWNGSQLTGRIKHYELLPADLSHDDLIEVAKTILPEATKDDLKALAIYARSSARYLSAIDSISTRAKYIAAKARREKVTSDDVQMAMKESVIPADSQLQKALATVKSQQRIKLSQTRVEPASSDPSDNAFPRRETQPAAAEPRSSSASVIEA
ncbi:MAG TPA: ATP-binding protein, partial [Pseudomonadales bacterium]|nr:ATP-binding protein [Pseudomonadales bacterium]